MNFEQFRDQVFRLYTSRDYAAALALIQRQAGDYPDNQGQMLYWRACIEGLLEQPEAALQTLQRISALEMWFDPDFVRADTDLAILSGRPEFENILAAFGARRDAARRTARPRLLILQPAASTPSPYPLAIAIHGRNDNARNFAEFWRPLTERGWLVALPQSSSILASDSFGWDDLEQAQAELAAHFERLNNDYLLDDTRILLAGFSQGGGLSIWMSLNQRIPATGFLALAPYLHGLKTLPTPQAARPLPPRGMLVTGDDDEGQPMFAEFETRLKSAGIAYRRRSYPELAHEIPPDFPSLLDATLEYLYA